MNSLLNNETFQDQNLFEKIYQIRGQKVMLDRHLSELYGIDTKVLKQAVRRNILRFPPDFMFELTKEEELSLRSQVVTLKRGEHSKYSPFTFTEHGVLMLSSVLKSERAVQVNIRIMRIYTRMREILLSNKDILLKMEQLEKKSRLHEQDIQLIFTYLKKLLNPKKIPISKIGYKLHQKK